MTGKKNGVAAKMKADNPYLENVHCVAHRLALVMSQSADDVPNLKKVQETLTSIFYYFKHSAVRVASLTAIQQILDSEELRYVT
jgi:hypothetical protein